jgi:hypothetical protein
MQDDLIQYKYLEPNVNVGLQWHYCSKFELKQSLQLESQQARKFPFEI